MATLDPLDQIGETYDDWFNYLELIYRGYAEGQDVDDIDRIYRQQEAQQFKSILEDLQNGTATWRDLAAFEYDFLSDIPEFVDYYNAITEKSQFDGYIDDLVNAVNSGDPEAVSAWEKEYTNAGIKDNFYVTVGGPTMPPRPAGLPNLTGDFQTQMIKAICQGSPVCAGVDICFEPGQTDCIDPTSINDLWEDVVSHVYIVFGNLGIPIPDLPIPLPGILKLPTLGNIWEKIQTTVSDIANSEANCRASVPAGENPDEYCSSSSRITRAIKQGSQDVITKAGEVLDGVLATVVGAVDDPEAAARKIWDWVRGAYGDDPSKAPPWIWSVIVGSEIYGVPEVQTAIEDIIGTDINDDGTIGTPPTVPFGPENPNPDCAAQGLETAEDGTCVPATTNKGPTQEDCSKLGRTHVPGDASKQTPSTCGGCLDNVNTVPEDENDSMSPCVAPENPNPNEGDPCNTGAPLNAEGTYGPAPDYECVPTEGTTCNDPETGKEGNIKGGVCDVTGPIWDGKCTSPKPNAAESFDHQDAARLWDDQCAATHCPSGVAKIDANDDCSGNYTPQPEACPSGQVRPDGDINKPCVAIGSDCDNGNGTYDDQGACVPKTTTGTKKDDPCDSNGDGTLDGKIDANGNCVPTTTGTKKDDPCDSNGDGTLDGKIDANGNCVPTTTGPTKCDNGATLESGCEECPTGYTFNFEGICVSDTGYNCDAYNKVTNDDGSCGGCKEGYEIDTSLPGEPCVKIFDGCPAGYVLDPDLGCVSVTCPEGQAYCVDTDGCVDIGTCPSDPPTVEGGGAFGGGGGGGGMLVPQASGYMGDPQLLTRTEFPITDFLAGIFTNSTGNKA